ncbi:unnamed protein product, partial [Owenia fusiformis]
MYRMQLPLVVVLTMLPLARPQPSVVTLPSGPISGTLKTIAADVASTPQLQNRDPKYREYLGIPFADPPVGNLRFKPPQPLSATWTDTRDVTTQNQGCMQSVSALSPDRDYSEDCLYLNVWAPGVASSSEAKAVMVWIHGGGFVLGSTEIYDGTMLTVIGDVIVVSMNYRLGAFGFLSTGDDVVPGNMGLLDQQLAIRWVKDNIALFGGDPERITIFGESAGAASVTQQAISPTNKGLFQRAISQSGTLFADWAFNLDMAQMVNQTGAAVGCNDANNADLVKCLRGIDAAVLQEAYKPPTTSMTVNWAPVVDKEFIVEHPREMEGKDSGPGQDMLKNIDLMIGVNSDEGYMFLTSNFLPDYNKSEPIPWENSTFDLSMMENLMKGAASKFGDTTVADTIHEALRYTYFGPHGDNELENEKMMEIAHDFITDAWFLVPAVELADLLAELGSTSYAYHMEHRSPSVIAPAWVEGADHGADLGYLFPSVELVSILPETERALMYNMITYWTNFAKTGNPNEPVANPPLPTEWPEFTEDSSQYLTLSADITPSPVGAVIKSDRINFWNEFLPKIAEIAKCSKDDDDDDEKCKGET